MTTHRSWFPFILVGLSAALLAVILVAYQPNNARVDNDTLSAPEAPTGDEYEAAVRAIMMNVMISSGPQEVSAQAAYDALLALHVPAEYKDVHIQLVLAYGEMALGQDELGRARLIVAEEANSWILEL